MDRSFLVAAGLALLLVAGSAACTPDGARTPVDEAEGARLVDERCSPCHIPSRIETSGRSRAEWSRVVDDMIERGAELDAEERDIVIDYLASLEE